MKFYNWKKWLILPLTILLISAITCDLKNPTKDVKIILNWDPMKTVVAVDFVDAKTNQTLTEPVTITFSGEDASKVVTLLNAPIDASNNTAGGGGNPALYSFAIDRDYEPTEESPVQFRIIAEAMGYLSTSKYISIDSLGGYSYTVFMVDKDNLPDGVNNKTGNGSANNNGTTSKITVQTDPDATTGCTATIDIPKGTVINDETGNPISGNVSVDLTYFNNFDEGSLKSFPGGFNVTLENGEEGAFVTGGFLAIDIEVGGTEAGSFDSPVTVTIELSENTINPNTGNPIAVGDTIAVWSYDDDTGEWAYESQGVISDPVPGDGKFAVTYQISHLSWWNLDWWFIWCQYGVRIIITGKSDCVQCLPFVIRPPDGIGYYDYMWVCDNWIRFYQAIPIPFRLYAYTRFLSLINWQLYPDMCENATYTFHVNIPSENPIVFHFTGYCADKPDWEFRPTIPLWFKPVPGARWRYAGLVRNGVISFCDFDPGVYDFMTSYEGEMYETRVTIHADWSITVETGDTYLPSVIVGNHVYYDVDLPADVCDDL